MYSSLRYFDESCVVVKLLFREFLTKNSGKFFDCHRLVSARVEKRRGFFFHIRADVIPISGYLVLFKIDFCRNVFFLHNCRRETGLSYSFAGNSGSRFGKSLRNGTTKNALVPVAGTRAYIFSCGATLLDTKPCPLYAYQHMPISLTENHPVAPTRNLKRLFLLGGGVSCFFRFALGSPFGLAFVPHSQHRRLSLTKVERLTTLLRRFALF